MRIEPSDGHKNLRYILRLICEQPDVVIQGMEIPHKQISSLADLIVKSRRTVLIGEKTGCSEAFFGQSVLTNLSQICTVAMGSDDVDQEALFRADSLLAISETGENSKMIELIKKAKAMGMDGAAIITARGSSLGSVAEVAVELNSGNQLESRMGNAEMAHIVILTRLAAEVAYLKRGNFTKEYVNILQELAHLTKCMEIILRNYQGRFKKLANVYQNRRHWRILGRDCFAPAALLFAVEASRLASLCMEGIPAYSKENCGNPVDSSTLCIAFIPPSESGFSYTTVLAEIDRVRRSGAEVIGFCFGGTGRNIEEVRLPKVSQWIAPFLHVLATEIFAYETAVVRHGP